MGMHPPCSNSEVSTGWAVRGLSCLCRSDSWNTQREKQTSHKAPLQSSVLRAGITPQQHQPFIFTSKKNSNFACVPESSWRIRRDSERTSRSSSGKTKKHENDSTWQRQPLTAPQHSATRSSESTESATRGDTTEPARSRISHFWYNCKKISNRTCLFFCLFFSFSKFYK